MINSQVLGYLNDNGLNSIRYIEDVSIKEHYILNYRCKPVYFISDGEYVKIGESENPLKRKSDLQTANARELKLLKVVFGTIEYELHSYFRHNRVRGEWFKHTEKLDEYLDTQEFIYNPDDWSWSMSKDGKLICAYKDYILN